MLKIFEKIIGNSYIDFSKRIINGMYFIVIVFLIFIAVLSKTLNFSILFPFEYIIGFITFFIVLYFYSKKRKDLWAHVFVIVIFSFAIITFLWFKTSGIQGIAPLVSISLLFVLHLILNIKQAIVLSILLSVWLFLLFLISQYYPELIQNKLAHKDLEVSLIIVFLLVLVQIIFGVILLRMQYRSRIQVFENQVLAKNIYNKNFTDVEKIYNFLFTNTNQGIAYTSRDETFMVVNSAANEIFGMKNETIVGRNLREFVPSEEFEKIVIETEKRKKNISSKYKLNIISADNKLKTIEVIATPINNVGFIEDGTVAIFRDVTEI